MSFHCYKCGYELSISDAKQVGRREACPSCQSDLHCCYNCQYYDPKAYNQCHETQAERVLEKEESNFCDYFRLSDRQSEGCLSSENERQTALRKLNELFK